MSWHCLPQVTYGDPSAKLARVMASVATLRLTVDWKDAGAIELIRAALAMLHATAGGGVGARGAVADMQVCALMRSVRVRVREGV